MKIIIVLRNIGPYHKSRFESLVNENLKLYAFETRPESKEYLWKTSNSCKYEVIKFPKSVLPEKDALTGLVCGSRSPLYDPNRAEACILIKAGDDPITNGIEKDVLEMAPNAKRAPHIGGGHFFQWTRPK